MRRKIFAIALACFAAAGCGTVRHNNVLLFGTDTSLGITAGTSATNVAQASVGYRRYEAVMMPLTANLADDQNRLIPCDVQENAECKFVAIYGDQVNDAYSVVATFGSDFAAGSGSQQTASGGIAQTFATGAAAQILALKGGAALVSTGEAARASAEQDVTSELAALVNAPSNGGEEIAATRLTHRIQLSAALTAKSGDALLAEMRRISQAVTSSPSFLENRCNDQGYTDRSACARAIAGTDRRRNVLTDDIIDDFYRAQQTPAGGQ